MEKRIPKVPNIILPLTNQNAEYMAYIKIVHVREPDAKRSFIEALVGWWPAKTVYLVAWLLKEILLCLIFFPQTQ